MLEGRDLVDFSISSWYKKFENVTLQTILVEIPVEIVKLIESLQFGIIEALVEGFSDDVEPDIQFVVNSFVTNVKNAINSLDQKAFVKNNWHAPIDAKVFSMNSLLVVTNVEELLQYLIASSVIMTDFDIKGIPFCLALKPWVNIHPASEFRCIVVNKTLRGITPRDWPTYYAHYKEEGPEIINLIANFFSGNIKDVFPRKMYTFDVIIQYPGKKILILDFGPLNKKANLYAFSWKEISPLIEKDASEEVAPVFRYLDSDIGIMTRETAMHQYQKAQ